MNEHDFNIAIADHCFERGEAINAFYEASPIEFMVEKFAWIPYVNPSDPKEWNPRFRFRRAPKPALRYWSSPDDVPFPCWINLPDDSPELVTGVSYYGVSTTNIGCEWSHLYKATWAPSHLGPFNPCTVPV